MKRAKKKDIVKQFLINVSIKDIERACNKIRYEYKPKKLNNLIIANEGM